MKKLKEKLKAIYHIIMDDEYAVYTVTIKNGKRVKGKTCCLISDNASKIFLETIVEFTKKIKKMDSVKSTNVSPKPVINEGSEKSNTRNISIPRPKAIPEPQKPKPRK